MRSSAGVLFIDPFERGAGENRSSPREKLLIEYYESQFILQTLRARQDTLSLDMAETPVNVVKARHACEYYCNLYEYNL